MKKVKKETRQLPSYLKKIDDLKMVVWDQKHPEHFKLKTKLWSTRKEEVVRYITAALAASTTLTTSYSFLPRKIEDWFKPILEDEDDRKIAAEIDYLKNLLDDVDKKLFLIARNLTNPFENIGKLDYQNRSAVKLLEIDYLLDICHHVSTDPGSDDEKLEKLTFYDICGGPGGFSEYIFSKCKFASGVGLTLRSKDEEKRVKPRMTKKGEVEIRRNYQPVSIQQKSIVPDWSKSVLDIAQLTDNKSSFLAYYGVAAPAKDITSAASAEKKMDSSVAPAKETKEKTNNDDAASANNNSGAVPVTVSAEENENENDGDITKPEIIQGLINLKPSPTLVVADGGFSVEGDENNQEIRHLHLTLSQCLVAICSLRGEEKEKEKGREEKFVLKIFDQRLFISNYIILLTAQFFEEFIPLKPSTSRPSNTERYFSFFKRKSMDKGEKEVEWMVKCLKWLYALYVGLAKVMNLKKRQSRSTSSSSSDKEIILAVIQSIPFPLPFADTDISSTCPHSLSTVSVNVGVDSSTNVSVNISVVNSSKNREIKETKEERNENIKTLGGYGGSCCPHLWEVLKNEQKKSQELQLEYLTAIHEVIALHDTFATIDLSSFLVRKNSYSTFMVNGEEMTASKICQDFEKLLRNF
jgi:hypothetical protein